jgi:CDP-4-dehydro-6-deoxyglucose reductase
LNVHTVTLANGTAFPATQGQTVLEAAETAGITLPYSCRSGRCGSCAGQVISGQATSVHPDMLLSLQERMAGRMLTCTDEARSDLMLDISNVVIPAGITTRTLPCRISALELAAADVLRIALRLPPGKGLRYLAGQSVDVIDPSGTRRRYSIANAPDQHGESATLELHVRAVAGGSMSGYWFEQARANDLLRIVGPNGTFFLPSVAGLDLVFLATGTGIAPVKAMMEALAVCAPEDSPRSIRLYWGGRASADLYWDPQQVQMSLRYVPVLSRAGPQWGGRRGHVQDALIDDGLDPANELVVACGSAAMIDGARRRLTEAGLPAARFLSDAFVASN